MLTGLKGCLARVGRPEWRVVLREAAEQLQLAGNEKVGVFCGGPARMVREVRAACRNGVPRQGGWLPSVPVHQVQVY